MLASWEKQKKYVETLLLLFCFFSRMLIVSVVTFCKKRGDYLLVGIHGDALVNRIHGMNLPLMNLHERVLSVLGCRYVDDVLIDAPLVVTPEMMKSLNISEVIHGKRIDNIECQQEQVTSYYDDIRYRHAMNLNKYTTIPYPTTFRISSVLQRIHKNQEVFQAKFETKMESERKYMATVRHENNRA
jgi:ethanolamine-phosphate cytidylyltransferase